MFGTDPVAIDRLLLDMIDDERKTRGAISVWDRRMSTLQNMNGGAQKDPNVDILIREPGHVEYAVAASGLASTTWPGSRCSKSRYDTAGRMSWLAASLQAAQRPASCVYSDRSIADSAADHSRGGIIGCACRPSSRSRGAPPGIDAVEISAADLASRRMLPPPGIAHRADLVSATRSPWLVASGWQFLRAPQGRFQYQLRPGAGALAAAEAFAYAGDAVLPVDASGLPELGAMLAFLRQVPAPAAQATLADLGVVDDGSEEMGEVLNLLSRRNLLFEIVKPRDRRFRVTVALGSTRYPREKAADPSAFALAVRRELTESGAHDTGIRQ